MGARKTSTKLKRQILDYVGSYAARYGAAPERAGVRGAFPEAPPLELDAHLRSLAKAGLIAAQRSPAETNAALTIPVQGYRAKDSMRPRKGGAAGALILNLAGIGCAAPKESYALEVPDQSMSNAGLFAGDIAILCAASIQDGDIVAALVGETLKLRRYRLVLDVPYLMSENPQMPDSLPAFRASIQGVLWASLRVSPCHQRFQQSKARKVDYTQIKPAAKRANLVRSDGLPTIASRQESCLESASMGGTSSAEAWRVNEQAPKPRKADKARKPRKAPPTPSDVAGAKSVNASA